MIFVTVGTNEAPFDRLLHEVAQIPTAEHFVIQYGHSSPTERPNCELVDFLSFEAMVAMIRKARMIVTHAGVGSIMVALSNGRRPVVVPRRRSFGEAVDDHQLQLGRRFANAGLVSLVETLDELAGALENADTTAAPLTAATPLVDDLRDFIAGVIVPAHLAP